MPHPGVIFNVFLNKLKPILTISATDELPKRGSVRCEAEPAFLMAKLCLTWHFHSALHGQWTTHYKWRTRFEWRTHIFDQFLPLELWNYGPQSPTEGRQIISSKIWFKTTIVMHIYLFWYGFITTRQSTSNTHHSSGFPSYAVTQICKYMQIYKYANMQICKYANKQICKYANIRIYEYTNIQINK